MKLRRLGWLVFLLVAAAAPVRAQDVRTPERVTLQLKWKHQFQFAGYYAAVEKGYYREAGFQVDIRELPEGDADPVEEVLSGRADFGVGASELALHRAHGKPVVVLAVILQHSPLVLIARGAGTRSIHDLAGKRVMLLPQETEIYAYLRREGIARSAIVEVPHTFAIEDLVTGRVDALSGYSTDEPYVLNRMKLPYSLYSPRSSGIDFYGDSLFTVERVTKRGAKRVAAFRAASLRGWQYAMDHPEEIADLILARYSKRHTRDHLLFEAEQMRQLMKPDLIQIGHINPGRWRSIADVYAEFGMVPRDYPLDGFIFDPFAPRDLTWFYSTLAAVLGAAAVGVLVMRRQAAFNRRLQREVERRRKAEEFLTAANERLQRQLDEISALKVQLEEQALRDSLTDLYNRRYFDDALERELSRARRQNYPLSLALLDMDHFKHLNDSHGHQAGDAVLRALARYLRENSRAGDLVCRWGGEEFVVVLPHMQASAAVERAEAWLRQIAETTVTFEGIALRVTLSAGIATWPADGDSPADLLRVADAALYRAKTEGRNRVRAGAPAC